MSSKLDDRIYLPEDVQPDWLNVIRRLQSVSKSKGLSLITITILADENGKPLLWLEPEKKVIEPKSKAEDILKKLTS